MPPEPDAALWLLLMSNTRFRRGHQQASIKRSTRNRSRVLCARFGARGPVAQPQEGESAEASPSVEARRRSAGHHLYLVETSNYRSTRPKSATRSRSRWCFEASELRFRSAICFMILAVSRYIAFDMMQAIALRYRMKPVERSCRRAQQAHRRILKKKSKMVGAYDRSSRH